MRKTVGRVRHYRGVTTLISPPRKNCEVDGCPRKRQLGTVCRAHRREREAAGSWVAPQRPEALGGCVGPLCDRKAAHSATTMCRTHHTQFRTHGEVWVIGTRLNVGKLPTVECTSFNDPDCASPVAVWGLCLVHARETLGVCWLRDCDRPVSHKQSGLCRRHRNAERVLVHKYGIGYQQRERMARRQGYRCAICPAPDSDNALHIDHDHGTGEVRGLLCGNCNRALGLMRHDPALLTAAIGYLGEDTCGALHGVARGGRDRNSQ